jgi:hypothetical protein
MDVATKDSEGAAKQAEQYYEGRKALLALDSENKVCTCVVKC